MAYTHRALPDRSTTLFVQRRFHTPPSFPILPFSTFSCACAHYRIPWYVSGDAGNRPRNTMQATAEGEGSDKIGISNCYVENARWDPRLFCTQPPDRGAYIYPPPPLLIIIRTNHQPSPSSPYPGREGANAESLPPSDICSPIPSSSSNPFLSFSVTAQRFRPPERSAN